jgi:hypothetical protein
MAELNEQRLALIPIFAESSRAGYIGRTALMKYFYFLQTLRNVPLGYRFTLYSYGPFDSNVLADLSTAESLGLVESSTVLYPGGYGYQIRPGPRINWIKKRASSFLKDHRSDIKWLSKTFGTFNSAELELVSTIIYADREALQNKKKMTLDELSDQVHEVKPHFNNNQIRNIAALIKENKLLQAVR